ncbi:hypothetical protein, partial [Salmonella sp. s51944]|uniref:hypothetical protein n=1 Tax=Salmonella sp. s51944 TaxID=3159655 RepID=UPI00397F87A6
MAQKVTSSELRKFRQEALQSHNKYRDIHGVDSIRLNDKLNDASQKFAELLARTGTFKHSEASDYGEN